MPVCMTACAGVKKGFEGVGSIGAGQRLGSWHSRVSIGNILESITNLGMIQWYFWGRWSESVQCQAVFPLWKSGVVVERVHAQAFKSRVIISAQTRVFHSSLTWMT